MIRAVVVGHTYIVPENRGKLRRIAAMADIDLTLVCPETWIEPDFGVRTFEPEKGLASEVLPVSKAGSVRRYHFRQVELTAALKRLKPDIVQLESEAMSLASLQLALTRVSGEHSLVLFVWDNIPTKQWARKTVSKISYRGVDHLIAGSLGALEIAKKQGFKGPGSVIPQVGVDPGIYAGAKKNDPWGRKRGFRLGYVGRMDRKKGVQDLLTAARKIPDVRLTLVGEGDHRAEFESLAGKLQITDRVIFTGSAPANEVPGLLKGMDALVLPSVSTPGWTEQFGHVLIEAMAAGVPVVGSASGAIPEVIGDAGLIFPEGDIGLLAEAISRLVGGESLRRKMAEKGLERVEDYYTDQAVADRTVAVWKQVLEDK
jgi:glycosyltransferase involved in cell wall biosynthesis